MSKGTFRVVALLLTACVSLSSANEQVDQRALGEQLLGTSPRERRLALDTVQSLPASSIGPELRTALFAALEREGRVHQLRYEAGRRGEALQPLADPEFIGALARAVIALRDPRSIPALTAALGTGTLVPRAIAGFGEQAVPVLVAVVKDDQAWHDTVNGALMALRFMVEEFGSRPSFSAALTQIRDVAEERLNSPQHFTTLWWAIDLAGVLRDSSLARTLQVIASDEREVRLRGVREPDLVEQTQKRASDRLAGIPPLPRH